MEKSAGDSGSYLFLSSLNEVKSSLASAFEALTVFGIAPSVAFCHRRQLHVYIFSVSIDVLRETLLPQFAILS